MSRRPFTQGQLRLWLNAQALFSARVLMPGICLLYNPRLKKLICERSYDLLLSEGVLVPILPDDSLTMAELEYQQRTDSTSYRPPQFQKLRDFAAILDDETRYILPIDWQLFREHLTYSLDETLLRPAFLRNSTLHPVSSEVLAYVKAEQSRAPGHMLRRSVFFFLADELGTKNLDMGAHLKLLASSLYNRCFADPFDLTICLPPNYHSGLRLLEPKSPPPVRQPFESSFSERELLSIPVLAFAELRPHEILALRKSEAGLTYFAAALSHAAAEDKENSSQELAAALRDYVLEIKLAVARKEKGPEFRHSRLLKPLRTTTRALLAGEIILVIAKLVFHHAAPPLLFFVPGISLPLLSFAAEKELGSRERREDLHLLESWEEKRPFDPRYSVQLISPEF